MRVICEGTSSDEVPVESGVPQGTVLGPLLFLCHINDLPGCVSSQVRLFADDCLLYRPIQSEADKAALQQDLKALEIWATKWGMRFNAKNCYIMHISPKSSKNAHMYSLSGHILDTVSDNPYLGLQISDDLKWRKHIANTTNKASIALGLLRRNLKFLPKQHKTIAYQSLVRSILEYGSIVWDPYLKHDIQSLERVQRRAARFIIRDYKTKSPGFMTQTLNELKLPTLHQRRLYNRLCFFYKIANGLVPAINNKEYLTPVDGKRKIKSKKYSGYVVNNPVSGLARNNSKCYINVNAKREEYKNSFFTRTTRYWNCLDNQIVCSTTLETFKSKLKVSMLD